MLVLVCVYFGNSAPAADAFSLDMLNDGLRELEANEDKGKVGTALATMIKMVSSENGPIISS